MSEETQETLKKIYDFVHGRWSDVDIKNNAKYDEIITAIETAYGSEIMMLYIDAGFTLANTHRA